MTREELDALPAEQIDALVVELQQQVQRAYGAGAMAIGRADARGILDASRDAREALLEWASVLGWIIHRLETAAELQP